MDVLKGYGTYLTGWAGILGGGSAILIALAQGGPIPSEAITAIQVGFASIFLRRSMPTNGGTK